MRESRTYGSVRGALSNERPYRVRLRGLSARQSIQREHGRGSRVTELCGNEACEEIIVPGGRFATAPQGILAGGSPE